MTAAEPGEVEKVAVFALEKVLEGDLDEARELVGQLTLDERLELADHINELRSIMRNQFDRDALADKDLPAGDPIHYTERP